MEYFQEIIQPEILSQEMETPIKKNSQNKSSNTSGMPHEAIKSCNEIRVNQLEGILITALRERTVQDGWQKSVTVSLWKNKSNKR